MNLKHVHKIRKYIHKHLTIRRRGSAESLGEKG